MSFEPRIFASNDADGDPAELAATDAVGCESSAEQFELPDDLVELASQLTCDANHLALRYPAGQIARGLSSDALAALPANAAEGSSQPNQSGVYRRPSFPWRAAMVFLISGVTIWTASHMARRNPLAAKV